MKNLDFHSWMVNLIDEEKKKFGGSESKLAKAMGIPQPTLNNIKNNAKEPPPTKTIVDAFINYFKDSHPEIYEVFGIPKPSDPRTALLEAGFPAEFADNVLAARSEYSKELSEKGITQDSPEAREIVKKAFARHGIQLTDTE